MSESDSIFGTYYDEQVNPPKFRPALLSPESGQVVRVFDDPSKSGHLDMPDERTLIYADTSGDVSNIWSRAFEGGTPKQLTKFTSEQIFRFSFSRDGKRFAMARGTPTADIVLIKGFR